MKYQWVKFYSIEDLINENVLATKKDDSIYAIYCWGWLNECDKFVPYYVGKTRSLSSRIFQHIANIKGGLYRIYSWDYMISPNFKILNKVDDRLLYIPHGIADWETVFKRPDVQQSVESLLKNLLFTWFKTKRINEKMHLSLERFVYSKLIENGHSVGAYVKAECLIKEDDIEFGGNETLCDYLRGS